MIFWTQASLNLGKYSVKSPRVPFPSLDLTLGFDEIWGLQFGLGFGLVNTLCEPDCKFVIFEMICTELPIELIKA